MLRGTVQLNAKGKERGGGDFVLILNRQHFANIVSILSTRLKFSPSNILPIYEIVSLILSPQV